MAKHRTANFVDRLLMKVDGAVAPIWNSLLLSVNTLPEQDMLFSTLSTLIKETPRLKSLWNTNGWQEIEPTVQQCKAALHTPPTLQTRNELIHHIIRFPVDLSCTLPLRLWIGNTLDGNENNLFIAFQLHHAAGDGRSLLFMVRRFWDLLNMQLHQQPLKYSSLAGPKVNDTRILKKLWQCKKALSSIVQPQYRQLARRGDALHHEAHEPGHPILQSCRIQLPSNNQAKKRGAELFYSAILASVVSMEKSSHDKLIRIRIPVDLRSFLSLTEASIENACSAIVLELPLSQLRLIAENDPKRLGRLLKSELNQALKRQRYFANALECIAISHIVKKSALQATAQSELLAKKRSSSLVITHFGDITEFITPPDPIKIGHVYGHTPVWGCNSIVYESALYLNITCFENIWNRTTIQQVANLSIDWLKSHYDLEGELF